MHIFKKKTIKLIALLIVASFIVTTISALLVGITS